MQIDNTANSSAEYSHKSQDHLNESTFDPSKSSSRKTAAIIVIGNEILSGRTLDTNTQFIANNLTSIGVDLVETRTIKDDRSKIIASVLEFSSKYDYVFTSGGIGPTHDDITSEAISAAFGREYTKNEEAYEILENLYKAKNEKMNPAREKMAYMPKDAKLIKYTPSGAPGFIINNVYVLAGVPSVLKLMMQSIMQEMEVGSAIVSKNLDLIIGESFIAKDFESLQNKYPQISMGSYPFMKEGKHATSLVLRSENQPLLEKAFEELVQIMQVYI